MLGSIGRQRGKLDAPTTPACAGVFEFSEKTARKS